MTSKEKQNTEEEEQEENLEIEDQEEEVPVEEKKKLSPLEELQEQLIEKDLQLAEQKGDFLREKADLENFRKRLIKDKEDSVQFANQRLLKELVQINDNLDRALDAPNASLESLREGIEMIQKQFATFLKNQKVEPIEALGKPFDPSLHEVMSQLESEDHDENIVMQEYSKGYTLNGRILCSAKVVIAKKPAKATPKEKTKESVKEEK
ncbi:MAG: nucleotide exchange factor GrpE [Nitrospina sp.]|jgi:molecular chaperone GrpE|nr:nucleotide exchange factor GrpE [Nitrospina sp.]